MALPSLHLIFKGSLPGKEFGVVRARETRGGDVKTTLSPGSLMKELLGSSMTPFIDMFVVFFEEGGEQ